MTESEDPDLRFIDYLELSIRARSVLQRLGIETREAFLSLDRPTVIGMRNAGKKTWGEIHDMQLHLNPPARMLEEQHDALITKAVNYVNTLLDTDPGLRIEINHGRLTAVRVVVTGKHPD